MTLIETKGSLFISCRALDLVAGGAVALSLIFSSAASASIATRGGAKSTTAATSSSKISIEMTKMALMQPIESRLQALQAQGPQGYRNLVAMMFNEKLTMNTRWRAVTAAGRIGGELSKPELERALGNRDWYMRNAALVALSRIDRQLTLQWARKLLSDKSLVVRLAAVAAIEDLKDASSAKLLWQKLYSKDNFRGKQSLFIRRHIVEALARMESPGNEAKFIEVLADGDETLHAPAISALERLTRQSLGEPSEPLKVRRAQWQHWWKEKTAQM